jgi:predicted DCC family thiol-disulfide oxidoreductase YuxK
MQRLVASAEFCGGMFAAIERAWSRLWFQSTVTTPLELTRIGIGAALLIHYTLASRYLFDFWSDAGWLPRSLIEKSVPDHWKQSVLFYIDAPWQLVAFHSLFLFCCAAFMLGWRTSWVKWIVLLGHISYDYRNPLLSYGVDKVLACLLFILCMAPIGRALSLDRVRAVRVCKYVDLDATLPPYASPWACACTRLMQVQMAILYFYSGASKFRGDEWWSGDALWNVFTGVEHSNRLAMGFLASHYWLVSIATYGAMLIEISYPFLIWQRSTRPYILSAAIFMHLQIGILMGMFYFAFVMIMGHLSFMRPRWLAKAGAAWKRAMGGMEMVYDGRCGFCVRSMAWLLAFDGLSQIENRDFRTRPSPLVSDAQMEKALYLVLPGGRTLPGFDAYRYVVLRVPGLLWLAPFFYMPILSSIFGRFIYTSIAANRGMLSSAHWGLRHRG